jgi:regulator of replication initiation timing
MKEERGISMNEFKTVVESFRSDMKKMSEVMMHNFSSIREKMGSMAEEIGSMKEEMGSMKVQTGSMKVQVGSMAVQVGSMEVQIGSVKEQVGLLHEGQTEIKSELRAGWKDKVGYTDFERLEKRVARLEKKIA